MGLSPILAEIQPITIDTIMCERSPTLNEPANVGLFFRLKHTSKAFLVSMIMRFFWTTDVQFITARKGSFGQGNKFKGICLSTGGACVVDPGGVCVVTPGGHAWLPWGVCGCSGGACVVSRGHVWFPGGGMHGFLGGVHGRACVVKGGKCDEGGACMVKGGMCGEGGCAW